jgi:hypothetical protein
LRIPGYKPPDNMGADKPGPSCDQYFHLVMYNQIVWPLSFRALK